MREEIIKKSNELGQHYFPNECNVWARPNVEAMYVTSACQEMAEWMKEKMIEKACSILEDMTEGRLGKRFISEFKNKLKDGVLERH